VTGRPAGVALAWGSRTMTWAGYAGKVVWAEPQVGVFPAGRIRPAGVTFLYYPQWMGVGPVWTMIQTRPDAKALVSTRRHGPFRNSRAPREHHDPRLWENRAHLWDTKKAVSHVFPGHGLDLLRARRDSNP
jgi:hypothetical protein